MSPIPQGTVLVPLLLFLRQPSIILCGCTSINMAILSTKYTETLQTDITKFYRWATETSMILNEWNFELLRYRRNEGILPHTQHNTVTGMTLTWKRSFKGTGVIMSDGLTFGEHNKGTFKSANIIGCRLRILNTSEARPMISLYKILFFSVWIITVH